MKLRRELKDALTKVVASLKELSTPVKTLEELEQVATISVEDPEIGKQIAKAVYSAGENGIVYVDESEKVGVEVEKVEGYQFPQGMITPYLLTNPEKMETTLIEPAVFITELQLTLSNQFVDMIQAVVRQGTKDILVICDEIHPDVLKFAVMNLSKGVFKMSIVKKPMQKEYLEDIASVVQAQAMTQNKGMVHPKIEYLGRAKKAVIKEKTTTLFIHESNTHLHDNYVSTLKEQMSSSEDEAVKVKLQERIAKLTGGVYIVYVGEKTEAETKYLRMKVDDAVSATKAAREEGIVAGGGIALRSIAISSNPTTVGEEVLFEAMKSPSRQLLLNCGEIPEEIEKHFKSANFGYDAKENMLVLDMVQAGIIDPVKVTRTALENATTFAGLFLTTETQVVPIPEKESSLVK